MARPHRLQTGARPRTQLNEKELRFVAAFDGNATRAAIAAGYSEHTARAIGSRLMKRRLVLEAIRARSDAELRPTVAHRKERQEFWTSVMRSGKHTTADRLRASELLGKSEADFTDKFEANISGIRPEVAVAAAMRKAQAR